MIAIIGAGGHGKVVADMLQVTCPEIELVIFDDAFPDKLPKTHWPVLGDVSNLDTYQKKIAGVIVAIGNNELRLKLTKQIKQQGYKILTVIHPKATVSPSANIAEGTVIMAGAIVNAGANIGTAVIVNSGAIVEHDCIVSEGCHLSPNSTLAGGCHFGATSWLCMGASVKQLLKIGSSVTIGAGAVVLNDLEDNLTVVGVPAKPIFNKD